MTTKVSPVVVHISWQLTDGVSGIVASCCIRLYTSSFIFNLIQIKSILRVSLTSSRQHLVPQCCLSTGLALLFISWVTSPVWVYPRLWVSLCLSLPLNVDHVCCGVVLDGEYQAASPLPMATDHRLPGCPACLERCSTAVCLPTWPALMEGRKIDRGRVGLKKCTDVKFNAKSACLVWIFEWGLNKPLKAFFICPNYLMVSTLSHSLSDLFSFPVPLGTMHP